MPFTFSKTSHRDPVSPDRLAVHINERSALAAPGFWSLISGSSHSRWGGGARSCRKLIACYPLGARAALLSSRAFQKENRFRFETGLFPMESTLIATRKAGFASNCASLRRKEARRVETAEFQIDATYPGAKMRGGHFIACSDRGRPSNKPPGQTADP